MVEDESEFSDEPNQPSTSRPARPVGAMPLVPRTEMVDAKLRNKIREGKFVEFAQLLPTPKGTKPNKRFAITDGLFEEVEDDSSLGLYQWIDAFVIYMSVTLEFFPAEAQGMLRHMQIVKRLQTATRNGVDYDYQFRRLKSNHMDVQWGEYLAELAIETPEEKRPATKEPYGRKPPHSSPAWPRFNGGGHQAPSQQLGICRRFNSTGGCTFGMHCRYSHKCSRCEAFDHPTYRCSKRSRN